MTNNIVIIVAVFLFVDFVILLFLLYRHFKKHVFTSEELQYIRSHWIRIIDSFNSYPKQAVLDADKLLDYGLSKKFSKKARDLTLGAKLKKFGSVFSDIDAVWSAHKLRNQIAHEFGEINVKEARNALSQFKKALNELGAEL
ncbi:MAG: hypothetical protein AAB848_01730 [Patescibacteria group bacterium]